MTGPFVFSRKCATCVFRPGNLMRLGKGRLQDLLETNRERGTALICHKTTYGQAPELGEVVCRGFYDAYGDEINTIRVINRLGGFTEVDPPEKGDRDMIENPYLTKWPEHRVEGTNVTPEQAGEIILRCTGSYMFMSNDHDFERDAYRTLGIEPERFGPGTDYMEHHRSVEAYRERVHDVGGLEYLGVGGRICSSYMGGPTGWVNWDGSIGTMGHNIGKWPTAEEVRDEWAGIAAAFPYLDLRSQLFNGEASYDADHVVIEWRIHDGVVEQVEPGAPIINAPARGSVESEVFGILLQTQLGMVGRERGVELTTLAEHYANVLRKFAE